MIAKSTFLLAALLAGGACFAAQTQSGRSTTGTSPGASASPPPAAQTSPQPGETDNTRMNQRDRNAAEPTADSQAENPADRELAAAIRKSITDDKSLSTYAHNIKVISQNGMVTLKGPVRTDAEKKTIEDTARKMAGASKVKSEITVEPEQK